MLGERSDVMQLRWMQFGVFSPINRLHSSKCTFSGKEPWNFRTEIHNAMNAFLRLRHALLPYLYTMNYYAFAKGQPLVRPMYYEYPDCPDAYPDKHFIYGEHRNQYFFGSSMLVAPIVSDMIPSVNMGKVHVWLPEGIYHDFFTGLIYRGKKYLDLYRGVDSIPVLVKAGSIIPMATDILGIDMEKNPENMEIRVYGGSNGSFVLYEDDNCSNDYKNGICVKTKMQLDWKNSQFTIYEPEGNLELIPDHRNYTIKFMGIAGNIPKVTIGNHVVDAKYSYDIVSGTLNIEIPACNSTDRLSIQMQNDLTLYSSQVEQRIFTVLNQAQIENEIKEKAFLLYQNTKDASAALNGMHAIGLERDVFGAVAEIMTADKI
jgi:alpha-glucosidase (family GH31 glycosyl hydrolase)